MEKDAQKDFQILTAFKYVGDHRYKNNLRMDTPDHSAKM